MSAQEGDGSPVELVGKLQKVAVKGLPMQTTKLNDRLKAHVVSKLNFEECTRPQELAIPPLLKGEDVMLRSPTGSGKTLAYALPILNDLQTLQHQVQRSHGPLALVLCPTRELAKQCYDVFTSLLSCSVWIVAGIITGGEKKKAQKACIRKGINVLVATPGRLLDHIKSTKTLSLKSIRWLVLDEADRLMDTGFEAAIKDIVREIDDARKKTQKTRRRINVLVSATLTSSVKNLAAAILSRPLFIDAPAATIQRMQTTKAIEASDATSPALSASTAQQTTTDSSKMRPKDAGAREQRGHAFQESTSWDIPETLSQFYSSIPCKQRLMCLTAILKAKCASPDSKEKMIVFLSSKKEVEFYQELFSPFLHEDCRDENAPTKQSGARGALSSHKSGSNGGDDASNSADDDDAVMEALVGKPKQNRIAAYLEGLRLFFLHGSMGQQERVKAYQSFSKATCAALICTDVAARGLDLPNVTFVVQMSAPASIEDYVHRIGRTARSGRKGAALLVILPSEKEFIDKLKEKTLKLKEVTSEQVLRMMPKHSAARDHRDLAIKIQLHLEHRVEKNAKVSESARNAYASYIRSYATYPSVLKHIFHVSALHFGHVAKSFGLSEPPSSISVHTNSANAKQRASKLKRKEKRSIESRMKQGARRAMNLMNDEFESGPIVAGPTSNGSTSAHKKRRKPMFGRKPAGGKRGAKQHTAQRKRAKPKGSAS